MFENQTYETVLQRMLGRVPDSIDKREGSIIYDALAPAAAELAQAYIELDRVLRLGYVSTSEGEYLERRAEEQNIVKRQATKAIREGTFNIAVKAGERFYIDGLHYKVIEAGMKAKLECETAGAIGNGPLGALLPVQNISGLTTAIIGTILVPGTDTETDASLKERYKQKITRPATSGNKGHYLQWAGEVPGVGGAKVFPLWDGPKTVKVVIVDATYAPASQELVDKVQQYIDPLPEQGKGAGMAPIGAHVTVESATEKTIDLSAALTLAPGRTLAEARQEAEQSLDDYLKTIAFKDTVVRYAQIGALLLNLPSVIDHSNLTVNGGNGNVALLETEIPKRGTVSLN